LKLHATSPHNSIYCVAFSVLAIAIAANGFRRGERWAWSGLGAVGREHAHACRRDGLRPDVQGMHRRTNQAAQPRHERVLELGQKTEDAHRAVANRSNAMPRRAQGPCSSHSLLLVIMRLVIMRRPVRP
jgi:hypothetical protein